MSDLLIRILIIILIPTILIVVDLYFDGGNDDLLDD